MSAIPEYKIPRTSEQEHFMITSQYEKDQKEKLNTEQTENTFLFDQEPEIELNNNLRPNNIVEAADISQIEKIINRINQLESYNIIGRFEQLKENIKNHNDEIICAHVEDHLNTMYENIITNLAEKDEDLQKKLDKYDSRINILVLRDEELQEKLYGNGDENLELQLIRFNDDILYLNTKINQIVNAHYILGSITLVIGLIIGYYFK